MHEAVAAIAACGVSPVVRIAANEGWMVKRKLRTVFPFTVSIPTNLHPGLSMARSTQVRSMQAPMESLFLFSIQRTMRGSLSNLPNSRL